MATTNLKLFLSGFKRSAGSQIWTLYNVLLQFPNFALWLWSLLHANGCFPQLYIFARLRFSFKLSLPCSDVACPIFFFLSPSLDTGLIELLSATVIDSKDLSEGRVSLPIDLWIPAEQCDEGIVSDLPADRLRRNEVFLALRERLCILKPS